MQRYTFTEQHMEAAKAVVEDLDKHRRSGRTVPEYEIIAQAIADAEKRGAAKTIH